MSAYMTDDEKVEMIKNWWKRYSSPVLIVISCLMLMVAGYRYWEWRQEKSAVLSSSVYEQLMGAVARKDDNLVKSYANSLIRDHNGTVYADIARLTLARMYVDSNALDKAEKELEQVSQYSKDASLQELALIRLARIKASQKSYEQALAYLNNAPDSIYKPIVSEIKGDIFAQTGNYSKAIDAYQTALNTKTMNDSIHLFLEMKMNEISAKAEKAKA